MKKYGCSRNEKGRFKRIESANKVVRVHLTEGTICEMLKSELDNFLDFNGKYALYQNGVYIIVDEVVYRAVKQAEWREAKRYERNKKANELSREKTADVSVKVSAHNETLVCDIYDNAELANKITDSPEDILLKQEKLAALHQVLETLSARDKEIITLSSNNYADAKIGELIGMSQRGVNKRKKAILAQLKKLLEKIL